MRRLLILVVALTLAVPLVCGAAIAETVAVIGTGVFGSAMGTRLAEIGHTVVYGSRDPSQDKVQALLVRTGHGATAAKQIEAAREGDMVVIAVPWTAMEDVVAKLKGELAGKIVIDVSNAIAVVDDGLPQMTVDTSGGELVQSWVPEAKVVKAFNAVGFPIVVDPKRAGGPVTIPVAGNNAAARKKIIELAKAMGFETMDAGPIRISRVLERLTVLARLPAWTNRRDERFQYYFRKLPADFGPIPPQSR